MTAKQGRCQRARSPREDVEERRRGQQAEDEGGGVEEHPDLGHAAPAWAAHSEPGAEEADAGEEEQVKLKQSIPVHIVYFTAWAGDDGSVKLVPDVYGYDALQK